MTQMQVAGVAAGVVHNAQGIHSDPQLKHRGHFWQLDHPEMGKHACSGTSFKLSKTPAKPQRPAPCLGRHTEYVCTHFLGMSDEEFIELMGEGVFE